MAESAFKKKVLAAIDDNGYDFGKITIASTTNNLNFSGKTIAHIASDLGQSSQETLVTIIAQGGSEILVFDECLDPEQVRTLLLHPLSIPSTDGAGFSGDPSIGSFQNSKLIHQRCFETMAKFITMAQKQGSHSLPEAIRKITTQPAQVLGLKKRGALKVGNFADMVLFDPAKFVDRTTESNPYHTPDGLAAVFVNGQLALKNGVVEQRAGAFLRKE
jgi:N-acyl-D-amino-acid deacylase